MDGAVKPWEWEDVSIAWLARAMVVSDAYNHAREVKEQR